MTTNQRGRRATSQTWSDGLVASIDVGGGQRSETLAAELAAAAPTRPSPAGSVDPAVRAVLDRHLANDLIGPLRSLRLTTGPAALVLDGLPHVDPAGPTPVDGTPTDDRLPVAKSVMAWLAERIGAFLCGYPNIAGGRFFHDVNPVRDSGRPLSSKGADLPLPFHSDSAVNDDRPDYLMLWSIRDSAAAQVLTGYAPVAEALRLLDEADIAELRRENYRIQVPTIADVAEDAEQWSPPVSIVSGPEMAPEIRLHGSRIQTLTPQAERALNNLLAALDSASVELELTPGRLLIINNRRGVHRRTGFTPTYADDERWLLRSYLLADPWVHCTPLIATGVDR